MQFAVTGFRYVGCKKIKKDSIHINLFVFFITLILVTIIITFTIFYNYNKNDYFSARKIVYLSLYQTKVSSQTNEYQSKVRDVGGAGYNLYENGVYHIVAFGYFADEDAKKVKMGVGEVYKNAELVERISPEIKRKVKNQIQANLVWQSFMKMLVDSQSQIYKNAINFDKSNISVSDIYKGLVKLSYEVQKISDEINAIKNDNLLFLSVKNIFITFSQLFKDVVDNCKSQIYKGENVSVSIKYLFVNLCEIDFEFRQELNKI